MDVEVVYIIPTQLPFYWARTNHRALANSKVTENEVKCSQNENGKQVSMCACILCWTQTGLARGTISDSLINVQTTTIKPGGKTCTDYYHTARWMTDKISVTHRSHCKDQPAFKRMWDIISNSIANLKIFIWAWGVLDHVCRWVCILITSFP